MSMRTVELVSEWDAVPFNGGYDGLQSLSDQGFSGAVTAGSTQLFMVKGTAVGVLDGDIEDYDGADGTARAAPHDALPLLVVMQDRADGPRAEYYTEDTSVSEVDRTLEDGNFTGFVELSENVLSGDYYLVYHQGRSMSVGWVGNARRLITDEEAFEQADGEVGIYQVTPADIEPIEIPAPPEPSSPAEDDGASAASTVADEAETSARDETDFSTPGTPEETTADEVSESVTETSSEATDGSDVPAHDLPEASESPEGDTVSTARADVSERGAGGAGPPGSKAAGASQGTAVDRRHRDETDADMIDSEPTDDATTAESEGRSVPTDAGVSEPEPGEPSTDDSESAPVTAEEAGTVAPATTAPESDTPAEPQASEAEETEPEEPAAEEDARVHQPATPDSDVVGDLETRSIPSLDPEWSSAAPGATTAAPQATAFQQPTTSTSSDSSQSSAPQTDAAAPQESETAATSEPRSDASAASDEPQPAQLQELEAELEERVAEIAALEGEIGDLSAENDELTAERDRLAEELDDARAEIQRLEAELEAAGGPVPSGQTLSETEAIDGTNLFIRYHSKGAATLAKAQKGNADKASVEENLRLEYHTQFDAEDAVVDGEAFEEFLRDSIQYRFVDWFVRSLLYEIRDTGHESTMGVLYDALPEVDRAELNGAVSVTYTEDGQEHRSQETFDVVVRDRLGNPLVVANINDTRQPATDGQMTNIVRDAERVGDASESLAAAFLVTSSFFEPEALETAREATSSGLLSRDKRKSFVNLSRKGGYHLCLLEARNKEFHLAVPEL